VINVNRINEEKRIVDLEYNLICDFVKLRNELGLTQKEMGEASNTIREIIAVIETRKKHPQINTLIKILEPFGYTLSITKITEEKDESR
jgi:DNA-binding XRE family transcriptional regulator